MRLPRSKKLVAGAVALVLLAGGAGAVAATQLSSSNPRQAYIDDVASRLNVTPAALTGAMKQALIDRINAAQTAGKLTAAQASAAKSAVQSGRGFGLPLRLGAWRQGIGRFGQGACSKAPCPALVPPGGSGFGPGSARGSGFGPGSARGSGFGPGSAWGSRSGPGSAGGPGAGEFGPGALAIGGAAATTYLGISAATLRSDLFAGKSLAQIASATKGKSLAGLESALTAAAKAQLDKAVAAGRITSKQETARLKALSSSLSMLVHSSSKLPFGRRWFRFHAH